MKRKIIGISLVLLLVLSFCLSTASPAIAADPEPAKKPVAWVNFATNTNNFPTGHQALVFTVKLLADGTTVGKVMVHNWVNDSSERSTGFDQTATMFYESGGAKIVEFVVYLHQQPTGKDFKAKYMLIDNGEPGAESDLMQVWIWLPDIGEPWPIWWPLLGTQDWTDPAFGLPVPIINGNIQIHLSD